MIRKLCPALLLLALTLTSFSLYAEEVTCQVFKGRFNCIGDNYTSPAGVITSVDEINLTINKKGRLTGSLEYTYDLTGSNTIGSALFSGKLGAIKNPKKYTYTASTKLMQTSIAESGLLIKLKTKAKAVGGLGVYSKSATTNITIEDQNGKTVMSCLGTQEF